jgi:hypothetical protein
MLLQQGQSEPSEPSHVLRSKAISGLQSILIVRHVKAPVASTLDPPMIADTSCKHFDIQWQFAEVVSNICLLFFDLGDCVDAQTTPTHCVPFYELFRGNSSKLLRLFGLSFRRLTGSLIVELSNALWGVSSQIASNASMSNSPI